MTNKEPTKNGEQIKEQREADRSGNIEQAKYAPQESQALSFESLEGVGSKTEPQASGVGDADMRPLHEECLHTILNLCQQFGVQVQGTEKAVMEVRRGQELQAAKLREVSDKIDDAATSFSEPRIRDLLTSLLLLHDLVDQMAGAAIDKKSNVDHERNYGVLLSQINQILRLHGIETITTDVPFNENLHRAIRTIETDDPSQDGRIVQVFQKGFRSQRRILRYANVEVMIAREEGKFQSLPDDAPFPKQTLDASIPGEEKTIMNEKDI